MSIHRGLFNTRSRVDHARKRKIVSSTFSPKNVREFEPYIAACVRRFLKKWDGLCEAATKAGEEWAEFDSLPWFNFLAFDVMSVYLFASMFGR